MKKTEFNIFEILSKDDKELSHSSMIKFLLEEKQFFASKLINQEGPNLDVHLEYKLDKKLRVDLLIFNGNKIIVIENKFKCLPQIGQLNSYSEKLAEKFPNKEIIKYLLYFEKGNNFNIPEDWNKITYLDIYHLTKEYLNLDNLSADKDVLIRHYSNSIKEYIDKYEGLKDPKSNILRNIFLNPHQNNNRFWLHLIFHELAALFDKNNFPTWIGSGSSYKPLINIHNPKWNFYSSKGYEFVIQLNGRNLKYYSHLKGLVNKQEIVNGEKERLIENGFTKPKSGKFKGKISNSSNTSYIYQEDVIEVIESEGKTVTLDNLKNSIENLIKRIESCG